MARTKGALNKRTRLALREAASGKLEGTETLAFLVRIANDSRRDEKTRMEAASIALPYLRPKLSAVEQTVINPEESMSEEQIVSKLEALIAGNPDIVQRALANVARSSHAAPRSADSGDNDAAVAA